MSIGTCHVCGLDVTYGSSFVNIGPTDWNDPGKEQSKRWVPADEDIHGWTPFVVAHPVCFVQDEGVAALVALVDDGHALAQESQRAVGAARECCRSAVLSHGRSRSYVRSDSGAEPALACAP
jgi:hypothetical protein